MNSSEILAAVTAHGLPGAPPLPIRPLDPTAWRALLDAATRDRITPLLADAISTGALPATASQRDAATAADEQAMRVCVLLERSLLDTATRLDDAGIPFRALKGPAVAHLDYPDPALRAFGDIDLLVPSDAFDRALAVLGRAGRHRRFPEVRPGFDRRFGKGACVVDPHGIQTDVHRTFVAGPFGLTIDLAELFASAATVTIGGHDLPVLDRERRFVHACFHAALGDRSPRLVALRDVAQLALTTPLDAAAARELAVRWRADAVLARAVRLAWSQLRLAPTPMARWADEHRPDPFQERALRAYTGPGRSYAAQAAAGLTAVRGVSARAAYLRALLVADPAYVARHDGGYRRRLHRAWGAFRATKATP